MKTSIKEVVGHTIALGELLRDAFQTRDTDNKIKTIEKEINETIEGVTPEELGLIMIAFILLSSKICDLSPMTPDGKIVSGVITSRALIDGMDKSAEKFGMNHFDLAISTALSPTFKPSKDVFADNKPVDLENMEPAGEC